LAPPYDPPSHPPTPISLPAQDRLATRLQDIPRDLKVSVLIELWHDLTNRSDMRRGPGTAAGAVASSLAGLGRLWGGWWF
jgi:hypothetical protein